MNIGSVRVPGVVWTLVITIAVALIHENLTGQYALYGDAIVAALLAIAKVLEVAASKPTVEVAEDALPVGLERMTGAAVPLRARGKWARWLVGG